MNILAFDQLLIKINHSIHHFCRKKQNNITYKNIFTHDIKNLINNYLAIRNILIQNRRGEDAKLAILSIKEFKKRLHAYTTPIKDLDLKSIEIAHRFRTAACFLNKDIVRIIQEQQLHQSKEETLSRAIFIPLSLLPVKYHQLIDNIILITHSLSKSLVISIVGSQALFALLVTLYDTDVDPIDIYKSMDGRDLDIRLVAPQDISDQDFIFYIQFLQFHMKFNPEVIQRCEILPHLKYCTFTDHTTNLDLVLTTDQTQFSNCSVAIPLFNWNRVIMQPNTLLTLSHHQVIINKLDEYVVNNRIFSLAFVMKLMNLLSPWNFQLSYEQQLLWDRITEKNKRLILETYHRKYRTGGDLSQTKEDDFAAQCLSLTFDEQNFPSLPATAATATTITKEQTSTRLYSTVIQSTTASIPKPVPELKESDYPILGTANTKKRV